MKKDKSRKILSFLSRAHFLLFPSAISPFSSSFLFRRQDGKKKGPFPSHALRIRNDLFPLLFQAQQELQQRLKDMIALESELVNRDIQITGMQDELSNAKVKEDDN